MAVKYLGGKRGSFRMKGPFTGVIYCIPGTGQLIKGGMDPKDCHGVGNKNGLCSLKEYEAV